MNILQRVLSIVIAIILGAAGVILLMADQLGIYIVAVMLCAVLVIIGIRSLMYYFSMAKHMVGGKTVLYRGIIFLDIGILTSSLADAPGRSLIIYISAVCIFTGFVAILRAREEKSWGSRRWIGKLIYGSIYILIAGAVLYCGFAWDLPEVAVDAYALGLVWSAAGKIASAFRRTAIVYIQ